MIRVSVLISLLFTLFFGLAFVPQASAIEAVEVKADVELLDLSKVIEMHESEGDRIQVSTAPGPDGIVRRIEVRARQSGAIPGWFVFALANNTDRQMDRYLVVPHFRLIGSGLLKPDLGSERVIAISTSQGFAPERLTDTDSDVFRVTLDPGTIVTFVGEMCAPSMPGLQLWTPEAFKDYVNNYTFYRGIVLGIAGLLALFLVILFVVKGAAMFPAAALLAWSVLAYLAIDFGFMGRLFDIPTAAEPIWRAVAEVVFSASILVVLFTYLTLHRWHVRYLHASGIWLIFLIAVLGIALFDPSMGAGIARISMGVTAVAGFIVILYLSYTGFDRAIMLIPTWILLLAWLIASGLAVTGVLDNDMVQPALNGGLVLLVLLFCFTIMQHAFSGGILAQGIVSDTERRALAIVGSGDIVWDWDVPRDRIYTSGEAERILGLKKGTLDGHARDWLDILHPQDRDRFSAMLDAVIEQRRGRINQDFRLRADDGHYRWFRLRVRPVVGTDGEVVRCVGTLLDITDQHTVEERLLYDAVHDNLTGLANRELLADRLGAAMIRTQTEGAAKPSVLIVDVDDFRTVNDNYGLSIGDSILLTIARRLSHLLKAQDSIARFYGDQFAIVLLSEQQPERIAFFADSVRKVLKTPIVFGDKETSLSVSIGIAILDLQTHKKASDLINDSELALYHAKRMGGDRIEPFRPSLRQQSRGHGPLDKDLSRAIDNNEFDVLFQPIVNLQSRQIQGFEALARWQHPERGTISPVDFIPAAERTGLIVPLGIYVMEEAARQLGRWQQKMTEAHALFMSVNISSEQLLRHDLVGDVKTALMRSQIVPGTLKLELTESLVMENPEYASQVLSKLRALGAGLSLDDFGTGYSSLSYLQYFPFDTLKIDKSFVGHEQGAAPIILNSVIQLARDLNLSLIAEGVEDEDAARQLLAMGCPLAQGFLFGKPVSGPEAEQMIKAQLETTRQMQEEERVRQLEEQRVQERKKAEAEQKVRDDEARKQAEEVERRQMNARQVAASHLPPQVSKPKPKTTEARQKPQDQNKAKPSEPVTGPEKASDNRSLQALLAEDLAADLLSDKDLMASPKTADGRAMDKQKVQREKSAKSLSGRAQEKSVLDKPEPKAVAARPADKPMEAEQGRTSADREAEGETRSVSSLFKKALSFKKSKVESSEKDQAIPQLPQEAILDHPKREPEPAPASKSESSRQDMTTKAVGSKKMARPLPSAPKPTPKTETKSTPKAMSKTASKTGGPVPIPSIAEAKRPSFSHAAPQDRSQAPSALAQKPSAPKNETKPVEKKRDNQPFADQWNKVEQKHAGPDLSSAPANADKAQSKEADKAIIGPAPASKALQSIIKPVEPQNLTAETVPERKGPEIGPPLAPEMFGQGKPERRGPEIGPPIAPLAQADKKEPSELVTPASDEPAEDKKELADNRASEENKLPFDLPDMSKYDDEIASAIRDAMISSTKR